MYFNVRRLCPICPKILWSKLIEKESERSISKMELLDFKPPTIIILLLSRYFYVYTLGYTDMVTDVFSGYSFEAMLEIFPQIFHTASIWLTLALALQRWINVCHAVTARLWCTMSITRKGIAGIMVMSFLHQATR